MRERRGHRASGTAVFRTAAIVASAAALLWGAGGGVWGSRDSETSVSVTNSTANAVNVGIRVQTAGAASLPYMNYAPFNAGGGSFLDSGSRDGAEYKDMWPSKYEVSKEPGQTLAYDLAWNSPWGKFPASTAVTPLLKVGACNEPRPGCDADPISLEELAALTQSMGYYDKNYRYAGGDWLGKNGGVFAGGMHDSFCGETQFQFAIPEEDPTWKNNCATVCSTTPDGKNKTYVSFNIDRGGRGAMFWMAAAALQELFGFDYQVMIGTGMKETNFLLDNNAYAANQDVGNLTPFAFAEEYNVSADLIPSFPTMFQHGISNVDGASYGTPDGLRYWQYVGAGADEASFDRKANIGLTLAQWQDLVSNNGSMAINAILTPAMLYQLNYHVLSQLSNLGYTQVLENSTAGFGDHTVGFCIAAILYNKGLNTSMVYDALDPSKPYLANILDNPNACDYVNTLIPGNIGSYAGPVVANAGHLESASKHAETDASIEILDRWITESDLKRFWFGQVSWTDSTPGTPDMDARDQVGGLLLHFKLGSAERRALWNDVKAAFDLQAQKWGGGKISLRYDWLSNLRVGKSYIPRDLNPQPVSWINTNIIEKYSGGEYDGTGARVDKTYPFLEMTPVEATDAEGFAVEIRASDPREGKDRGIRSVEWTIDTLWRSWNSNKVSFVAGTPYDAQYRIDLSKSDLAPLGGESGWLWVRTQDSCGNAVAAKSKIVAVKYPKIVEAFIEDVDGDGNGDRITVTTVEEGEVTASLKDATGLRYSWPGSDSWTDGAAGLDDVRKGPGTFAVEDRTLKGGAATGLGGKVEISIGSVVVKGAIADRVGPVIKYASIRPDAPDTLYVIFSETVDSLANPVGNYLKINGDSVAVKDVFRQGQSWVFVLKTPLKESEVKAGTQKASIVPGAVLDLKGNPAAANNVPVPIVLDDGPLKLASEGCAYLDVDADGRMDRVRLKFTRPAAEKLATLSISFVWRLDGRAVQNETFEADGSELTVDDLDEMTVYYDVPDQRRLAQRTHYDLLQDGWGRLTVKQTLATGEERTDEPEMADAMGPVAVSAKYSEAVRGDVRPDTLRVQFSEPVDTAVTSLFSDRLYWTKNGDGAPVRTIHQSPAEKKRVVRGEELLVYYQPKLHTVRPGVGDSLRLVAEAEDGLVRDRAGNRAPAQNPWVVLSGKLRGQLLPLKEVYRAREEFAAAPDTVLFFDYRTDLDSIAKRQAGTAFTISFADSADEPDRTGQLFGYEIGIFDNLGNFVKRSAAKFNCEDMERAGEGLLAAACSPRGYPAGRKVKVWIPWNYRAENGRVVGAGAYIQQVRIRGTRTETIEAVRTFGVLRRKF